VDSIDRKVIPLPRRTPSEGNRDAAMTVDEALGLHLDVLYRTARMLTGNVPEAEDLVQETALRAVRAWGELRATDAARGWLLRILRRTFLNQRRHEHRRPPRFDVDVDLNVDALITHPILGTAPTAVDVVGLSTDVAAALDALPTGFREVVWLVDVEELTLAEAAAVLEIPVGTVASRVYRARRLLRDWLSRSGEEG